MKKEKSDDIENFDFGNFDIPDIDLDVFDLRPEDEADPECRYIKPKYVHLRKEQICYENAQKLARDLRVTQGCRYDLLISGSFIFGDFIEAFMTHNNCRAEKMTITTLSLSQNNVDSLHNLLRGGYIGELILIVSDYFYAHERSGLVPYIYKQLDQEGYNFQLVVAFCHTKTVHMITAGGKKIVMHGSANLRTSGNVEQFTLEENPDLYDFYERCFAPVAERFATIRKTAPRKTQWADMTTKKFD